MTATATRSHYDVLGISRDADAGEVKRAWKVLVQVWHPDRFTGEMAAEAERTTASINAAYHVLRDQSRRAAYDCSLAAEEEAARPAPRAAAPRRTAPHAGAAAGRHAASPPEPPSMSDVAARASQDIIDSVRRSPRAMGAFVVAVAVVLLGAMLLGNLTGPSLPAGASDARAADMPNVARSEDMPTLEELVDGEDADAGLALDAPLPDGEDAAGQGAELTQDDVLDTPALGPDPQADVVLPPRVVKTRKNGKNVLRVLPSTPVR